MARGRRVPTSIKTLEGEPHKNRIRELEAEPDREYRRPPDDMMPLAVEKWEELGPKLYKLGLLTEIDFDAFRSLCMMFAKYREAEDAATLGVVKTASGYVTQHPMINVAIKYFEKYHKLMVDFGMTPAARSKIDATPGGGESTPIEELLSGPRLIKGKP